MTRHAATTMPSVKHIRSAWYRATLRQGTSLLGLLVFGAVTWSIGALDAPAALRILLGLTSGVIAVVLLSGVQLLPAQRRAADEDWHVDGWTDGQTVQFTLLPEAGVEPRNGVPPQGASVECRVETPDGRDLQIAAHPRGPHPNWRAEVPANGDGRGYYRLTWSVKRDGKSFLLARKTTAPRRSGS